MHEHALAGNLTGWLCEATMIVRERFPVGVEERVGAWAPDAFSSGLALGDAAHDVRKRWAGYAACRRPCPQRHAQFAADFVLLTGR